MCVFRIRKRRKEKGKRERKDKPSKLRAFLLVGSILSVSSNQALASSLFILLIFRVQ